MPRSKGCKRSHLRRRFRLGVGSSNHRSLPEKVAPSDTWSFFGSASMDHSDEVDTVTGVCGVTCGTFLSETKHDNVMEDWKTGTLKWISSWRCKLQSFRHWFWTTTLGLWFGTQLNKGVSGGLCLLCLLCYLGPEEGITMGNWQMIPNKAWCQRQWTYQQMRPICYVSFLNMLSVLLFQWRGRVAKAKHSILKQHFLTKTKLGCDFVRSLQPLRVGQITSFALLDLIPRRLE